MSERQPKHHSPEHGHHNAEQHGAQKEKLDQLIEKARETKEKSPEEVHRLSHEAKEKAHTKESLASDIGKESEKQPTLVINKAVKQQAYKKTLKHVQRQLPRSQRTFSKFIHNNVVEKVSDVSSKTIARPSGLLGGGFFALLGTSLVVWMSRHYGFKYNFFVYIALVIAGFFAGLLLEALYRSGRKLLGRR